MPEGTSWPRAGRESPRTRCTTFRACKHAANERTNHCVSVRLALGLVATKIVPRSPEELTAYTLRVRAEQCTAPSSDASRRKCGRPYASAHLDRVRHAMEAFAAVEGRRADRNGESVGAVCLGSDRDVPATHFLLAAVGWADRVRAPSTAKRGVAHEACAEGNRTTHAALVR